MFVMVAVKTTVNVSATLIVPSNQLTIIVIELNVKNVVLPETDPVATIV